MVERHTLRFELTDKQRANIGIAVTINDVLADRGFDLDSPILWHDDPARGVRVFTQEVFLAKVINFPGGTNGTDGAPARRG